MKELGPEDHQQIVDLVALTMGESFGAYYKESLSTDDSTVKRWGVKERGKLHGVCGLFYDGFYGSDKVWLTWFAVHPEWQRRGLGCYMMEHLVERAGEQGYRWLYVETYDNERFRKANNFYRKEGFRFAGMLKEYLPSGADALYYRKQIYSGGMI